MMNLLSAATSTPQHAFQTTDLANALLHKLTPELINTINSLGVEQRYSVMDNYPDFLAGKPMHATVRQLSLASEPPNDASSNGRVIPTRLDC